MFKNKLYQFIGIHSQDIFRGTSILKTLKFMNESQYWDEERLRDYQLQKLKRIVKYAYDYVPYYSDLFKRIKLNPTDIASLEDITKIPVLTKENFRKNNNQLISKTHNLRRIKKGKTGGTTGAPVFVYKDTINRSFTWASYYRWYNWMGLDYGDPTATFWGTRTVLSNNYKRKIIDAIAGKLSNSIRINSFNFSEEGLKNAYERIYNFQPYLIKGYLSALLDLASFIKKNNHTPILPKAISSTTETLLPIHRRYLESVFKTRVYDQYGCGEVSAISYECNAHEGLHVTLEHVICEILDDNNQCVYNKKGRVIATDLDNYVMPIIRYDTGDISSISTQKCSCGRVHPLMNGIDGRLIDTLTLKTGAKVHGVFITDILAELNLFTDKIRRFQIVQGKEGSILFYIEAEKKLDTTIENQLRVSLLRFVNSVKIVYRNKIPNESNGKFRYIKTITE